MAAAAQHLASVTLELGGKSPAIIEKSAPIEASAEKCVWAKHFNNGQTCIAPDYLMVQEDVAEAFTTAYQKSIEKLYNAENKGIVNSPDYCRIINTRHFNRIKDLFDDARFENYVNTNVNRSTIESALGGVFEAGLKSAIFSAVDDPNAPLDLSQSELAKLSRTFKGAKGLGKFTIGEVKNALNDSNAESMANKIASSKGYKLKSGVKTKASVGYIPNFSALASSIGRELEAGIPAESIRIGKSRLLMSNKNPMGLGVYNTKDEPRGLSQGISRFSSLQDARQAGASNGFIPNYAIYTASQAEQGPILSQGSKELEVAVSSLIKSVLNGSKSFSEAKLNIDQLSRQFDIAEPSLSRLNNSLRQADLVNRRLVTETEALVSQSGRIFTGRRALEQLERRAAQGGVAGELARGGLEQGRAARSAAASRLQGIGIGASIAVPITSQIAQEFFPENKAVKFGTTVLGDTAAFAGTGALFGPYGAAIGGLIGVTIGLTKAFKNLNDNAELLARNSRDSANRVSRFSEDVQSFLISREKAAGIESGNITGTPTDLAKIESERDSALARIYSSVSPKVQKALEEAYINSNEQGLQAALQAAQDEIASANFVNQFIERVDKDLKNGAKNLDLTDLLRQFTSIRTTSGKYIGDLLIEQKNLFGSFDILANASEKYYNLNNQVAESIEAASVAADRATMSINEFTDNDLFGFNTRGLLNFGDNQPRG
ncbi:MAG: aldehyde dehydrogenase family protein, partial [Spirochaetia bacterium]|nr:aldehyde dehydrogenase family protein [Spirochaetia bacterium]